MPLEFAVSVLKNAIEAHGAVCVGADSKIASLVTLKTLGEAINTLKQEGYLLCHGVEPFNRKIITVLCMPIEYPSRKFYFETDD